MIHRCVIAVIAFCFAGISLGTVSGQDEKAGPIRIDRAVVALQSDDRPGEQGIQPLPFRWDKTFPHTGGRARFTMSLPPTSDQVRHGLYFRRLGNQATVSVGGAVLLRLGQLGDPSTNHARAPVLIEVPAKFLSSSGPSTLEIEITTQAGRWGGLSAVAYGPIADVSALYQNRYHWRQTTSIIILFSLVTMGLLAFWLWLRQREALFALFALLAALGAPKVLDRILVTDPLPWPAWGIVSASGYALHVVCVMLFALLIAGVPAVRLRRILAVAVGIVVPLTTYSFIAHNPVVWTMILAALLIPSAVSWFLLFRTARQTNAREAWILLVAGSLVVGAGVRDFLVVRLPTSGFESFSIMPIALFLLVLFMAWIIVERFSTSVARERELSATLVDRIAQRENELQQTYEQLEQKGREQATLKERQRIMRDIHDGVGAHLVSLLNLAHNDKRGDGRIAEESQMALDELRMAIDSLQPVDEDVGMVLATLRYRMLPRLEEAGLRITWDVEPLPASSNLTPSVILNVQRILLEAFTNIIRHASASHVTVTACLTDDGRIKIEVLDDGRGLGNSVHGGNGLRNMQSRAQSIGARLSVENNGERGVRVTIELPNPESLSAPADRA